MMPTEPGAPAPPPGVEPPVAPVVERIEYRWHHKMAAVLLITFCLEIGLFLLIFPWTEYWDTNYFIVLAQHWRQYWDSMYVRGAVSGLGIVNLYISLVEVFRLRRFAKH